MTGGDPEALLALAERVARRAGAVLLERQARPGAVRTKSSATDPVSEADQAAEEAIVGALCDARPDDAVLAEEGAERGGSSGVRWVVDPLDGTVNYLYGLPAWAVSVAAEDAGGAIVGVVHDPSRHETWTAIRGGGSFRDGTPLHVNEPVALDRALVATGFSYRSSVRAAQAEVAARLLGAVRDIRRVGAAALDLCAVAGGRVDGYYERDLSPWDHAAGALIAAEAGAALSWLGPELVVAGPSLHPHLVGALEASGAVGAASRRP